MSIAIAPNVVGLTKTPVKRFAQCWRFSRTDGVIIRLTSHDLQLSVDGETYSPVGSFNASARQREAGLAKHDVEFRGVISSSALTTADLLAGRYDDAQVTEKVVDWKFDWCGPLIQARYWIDKTEWDGEAWAASVTGIARWLDPRIGDVYNRTCRHNLGDGGCTVNLAGYTLTGCVVDGTLDGEKRRIIRAASGSISAFADNWFAQGDVIFTSGANAGLKREVKLWTQATLDIELQRGFPFNIVPGDVFTIIAGCNKLKLTCGTKFSNVLNFGGYPWVPGIDAVLRLSPTG